MREIDAKMMKELWWSRLLRLPGNPSRDLLLRRGSPVTHCCVVLEHEKKNGRVSDVRKHTRNRIG